MSGLECSIDEAIRYAEIIRLDPERRYDESIQMGEANPDDVIFGGSLRATAKADDHETFRKIMDGGIKYMRRTGKRGGFDSIEDSMLALCISLDESANDDEYVTAMMFQGDYILDR